VPRGKLELISEPRYHEVRCGERQSYTCSFEIEGLDLT
jgi:hypothetical protein